ncbi:hypothetical protein ACWDZ6_08025 [Streptomyces sp. NPDC002926]
MRRRPILAGPVRGPRLIWWCTRTIMARLHTTGIAQEFDMAGSSSVKHYDLGASAPNGDPLPKPDEPGREGGRTDPGGEQQEGR